MSPKLLRVHAALAEVLHMIGGGDPIDQFLCDLERVDVLAADGSDAPLLMQRLGLLC